ncbi:MAG: hypothetical protein K9J75_04515 [Cyanobium usitatum Tobar12.5m-G36]|nr:hypothetical protein [Cyanobium usitatum Tobar12.5m-G36]
MQPVGFAPVPPGDENLVLISSHLDQFSLSPDSHHCAGTELLQATKQSHLAPICSQKQCV